MRTNFKFALMSATALLSLGLASCSSNDEEAPVNPTYDGKAVKTQFTISVPGALNTRMTALDAQEDEKFSGMKDIKLYPYPQAVTAGSEAFTNDVITLADLAPAGLNLHGSANEFNSTVYEDVSVPIGTTNFLFYGKKTTTTSGALTATFATKGQTAGATSFAQVKYTDKTVADVNTDTEGAGVLTALNAVAAKIEVERKAAEDASEAILATIADFQTLYESNTAGAAKSISALFEDMSETLGKSSNTRMADIKTVVDDQKTAVDALTFPRNLNLPDGAVGVACTSHTFAFSAKNNSGMGTPELNTYVKPAELYYYVNTPIHVSYTTHKDEYNSQPAWTDVVGLYTNGQKVANTTRGIVLDNKIQYAVAQFVTNVKVNMPTSGKLKANDGTPDATKVEVTNTAFNITGILVGSQGDVDWKFQPAAVGTNVVYDGVWSGTTPATTTAPTTNNYTLVLETPGISDPTTNPVAGSNDEVVRVAVELENNDEDFFGINDQLIPKGARFYLVAELKVSDAWTTGKPKKIFQQDYKTIASFVISENSLCNAYNTIPDLRTPKMELGLAVDLKWEEGLKFNNVNLGGL